MLPKWLGRKNRSVAVGMADSFHTAPGWRLYGPSIYTCIEPAGGPHVDPDVLSAIHEFDPEAVPIWQVQAYMPPGEMGEESIVRVAHVGIARHVAHPRGSSILPHVDIEKGEAPNVLDFMWTDSAVTLQNGGPGTVKPFDWSLYRYCRDRFNGNASNLTLVTEWLDAQDRARERAEAQVRDDMEYRRKHAERNIAKVLDRVTYKELMNQYMEIRERQRLGAGRVMVFHGGR